MRAASPAEAHAARLHTHAMTKAQSRPQGNYDHDAFQWGYVHAIHAGPPPTVDLYLDGAQNTNNPDYLTPSVTYDARYVPTVGDVVLGRRGLGRSSSDRFVVGKPNGSASPYPVPLGGIDSNNRFVQQIVNAWSAESSPPPAGLGAAGDWCFTKDGHVYWNSAGTWDLKV